LSEGGLADAESHSMKELLDPLDYLRREWSHPNSTTDVLPDDSVRLISLLRWALPVVASFIATAYVIFEQCILQEHSVFDLHVLRTILVVGILGPSLTGLALTWAQRAVVTTARVQRDLSFNNRELAALNAIGEAAAQSLELEEIAQMALAKMLELWQLDAVEFRLVERDRLVLQAHHGVSPELIAKEQVIRLGHCLCGRCVKLGEVQRMEHLQADQTFADTPCGQEGFESSLSIPMEAKGKVLGVIHVASRDQNSFSQRDQEILVAIANRVASAVENSILYEQAKRRAAQLETTSLIGQRLTALLEPNSLLSEMARLIREKFGYYHTGILLCEESTGELVLKEASGHGAHAIKSRGLRLKVGHEGIAGWVAHTGQAFLCNDVTREPRYYHAFAPMKTRAELAVPLRIGNRIVGVLDVQSDRVNVFNKEDLTLLQILANQLGVAIENARLFQETRQRYEAMIALHETSLDMISQFDMPELLNALLRRGVQLLGAHAAVLFLYDAKRGLISSPARYNTVHDMSELTWVPGEGSIGRVIQTGKPLIINDYENWEGREAAFSHLPLTHPRAISVPLIWQNQVIGGMNILNRATDRLFDQNDLWLMNLFADLATIAIKNAELHTQVKEFSQEMEQRVIERTQELMQAKEQVAAKAQQLRSLLAKTIRIQEEEQARIARDMHDGVIQLVSAIKFELRAARVAAGDTLNELGQEKLDAAREVVEEIEKEIRRTIYDLHPAILDSVGLVPALEKFVGRFQEVTGVQCAIQTAGAAMRLPPSSEIAIYRLVEEALHNVATHANARSAIINMDFQSSALCLSIQDDGQGFDYQRWKHTRNGRHLGLIGMQERVTSLKGEMNIYSELGQGTRLTFHLPLALESTV
jgi:signal transduction histidine kinase/putative methionine-R-sulfoxide reductase with GAF domain